MVKCYSCNSVNVEASGCVELQENDLHPVRCVTQNDKCCELWLKILRRFEIRTKSKVKHKPRISCEMILFIREITLIALHNLSSYRNSC